MKTRLLVLVGPQGCGKSTLAQFIVGGLQAAGKQAFTQEAEAWYGLSAEQVRQQFAAYDVVVLEAETLDARHASLAPCDQVWSLVSRPQP